MRQNRVRVSGYFVLSMLMLSLFMPGLIKFELFGLSTTSWDMAILLSLGPAFLIWHGTGFRRDFFPRILVVVMAVLFVWYLVAGARNAGDFHSWTIVAMFLRGQLVTVLIVLSGVVIGARGVIRTVFWVGVLMSTLALLLYVLNTGDIPPGVRRPFGGLILMVGEGRVIRIIGLAQDPNIFAIPPVFAIGAGLFFPHGWRHRTIHGIALGSISLALLLTVSRSGITGAVLAVGITLAATMFAGSIPVRKRVVSTAILGSVMLVVVVFTSVAITSSQPGGNVITRLPGRFERTFDSPRFKIWENIVSMRFLAKPTATATTGPTATATTGPTAGPTAEPDLVSSPRRIVQTILGDGNSRNLQRLGIQSHNSYLDIWVELGLIGTLLWLAVAVVAINILRGALPLTRFIDTRLFAMALVALIMSAVMMSSAAMMSLPYLWVGLGFVSLVRLEIPGRQSELC